MRILFLAVSVAIVSGPLWGQDDAEAKKKRLAALMKEMAALEKKAEAEPKFRGEEFQSQVAPLAEEAQGIARKLCGDDDAKFRKLIEEVVEKYAPELKEWMSRAERSANERNASASLKTITTAQADFRSNDRDGNGVADFWVADVSGLYRISPSGRADDVIRLIESSISKADARPCVALDAEGKLKDGTVLVALGKGEAKMGYRYAALETYEEDGKWLKYDDGSGRCAGKFGFAAYPVQYGRTGKLTFIVDADITVWKKDTHGEPPSGFPADPAKAGWVKAD